MRDSDRIDPATCPVDDTDTVDFSEPCKTTLKKFDVRFSVERSRQYRYNLSMKQPNQIDGIHSMATSSSAPNPIGILPSREEMETAFFAKDMSYDGIFWVGVSTTGIFCRPSCPAKKPHAEHLAFFSSPAEAVTSGYRPCKRCRPSKIADDLPEWAKQLLELIEQNPSRRISEQDLRERELDPARVRRLFGRHFGMSFQAYARSRRLSHAYWLIRNGGEIDDAAVGMGWDSHSGFREAFIKQFGLPPGKKEKSRTDHVRLTWIESPLGPLIAGATEKGLCLLEFCDRRMIETQLNTLSRRMSMRLAPGSSPFFASLEQELREYFAGTRRDFDIPLIYPGTEFQIELWEKLRAIPYGQTRSYEEMAVALGSPAAVRAVGTANGANRIAIIIPCHRVIGKDGRLAGYGGGLWRKYKLLRLEAGLET